MVACAEGSSDRVGRDGSVGGTDAQTPGDGGEVDAGALDGGDDDDGGPVSDAGPRVDATIPSDGGGQPADAAPSDGGATSDAGPQDAGFDASPPLCTRDEDCDDGLFCNGAETCGGGDVGCVPGTPPECDDMVDCTTDACDEEMDVCSHTGVDADGDGYVAQGCLTGGDCNDDPMMSGADVNPGAMELCNGADDNCAGGVDEGFDCVLGSGPVDCTTTCMTPGTRTCDGSCTLSACVAPMEVCGNRCDDDGNGTPDDGCPPDPPTNDLCAGAIELSGSSSRMDTLWDATTQVLGCADGGEVFYRVVLTEKSIIYLDTIDSGVDTRISYLGATCPGTPAQCQDNGCGGPGSQLALALDPGTHYFAVHEETGVVLGDFALRYMVLTAGGGDNVRITTDGRYTGTTSGATNQLAGTCHGDGGEDSFWWTQCTGDSNRILADTCDTSYDTVLHMRGNGAQLACNDDSDCGGFSSELQSEISATASGVGVFQIFVDGYSGTGSYDLWMSGL